MILFSLFLQFFQELKTEVGNFVTSFSSQQILVTRLRGYAITRMLLYK